MRKAANSSDSPSRNHRPGAGLRCGQHRARSLAAAFGRRQRHGPIQGFDTTGFPVTFAAEVKNFDPFDFVDKKEARKMGASSTLPLPPRRRPSPSQASRLPRRMPTESASLSAPASAALKSSSASTPTCCRAGRARFHPLHSRRHRQHGCRPGEHSLWRQRADFGHGHSLRHIGQRHRRLRAHDYAR